MAGPEKQEVVLMVGSQYLSRLMGGYLCGDPPAFRKFQHEGSCLEYLLALEPESPVSFCPWQPSEPLADQPGDIGGSCPWLLGYLSGSTLPISDNQKTRGHMVRRSGSARVF